MRTTITLETAASKDLRALADFNKRSISSEIAIAVDRWLLMNSAIVSEAKTNNKKGKTYGRK